MKCPSWSIALLLALAGCPNPTNNTDSGADVAHMDATGTDTASGTDATMGTDTASGTDGATGTDTATGTDVPTSDTAVGNDAMPAMLTCSQFAACLDACSNMACMDSCRSSASAMATSLFDHVTACSMMACSAFNDGGAPPCVVDPTSSACVTCMRNSRMGGAAGPCAEPASDACGVCSSQWDACLADR